MIKAELVDITPEMAERWLEKNVSHNRKVSMKKIDEYAIAMESGKWRTTHQGIAFDDKGNLLDGQHRLFAIYKSRRTITMFVFRDMDPDNFHAIDVGRNRTAADMVDITIKVPGARTVAAALKLIKLYRSGNRPWPTGLIGNDLVASAALELGIPLHQMMPIAQKAYKRLGGTKAAFAAAFYLISEYADKHGSADAAGEWIEGLITGVGLEAGDPRLALESWLKGTGSKLPAAQRAELTVMLTLRCYTESESGRKLNRIVVSDYAYYNYRLPE